MVDANGTPWMEYPWAEDGLDLWHALYEYFESYLGAYYHSDEDVLQDSEVQSWWQETQVSSQSHPQLPAAELCTPVPITASTGLLLPQCLHLVSSFSTTRHQLVAKCS